MRESRQSARPSRMPAIVVMVLAMALPALAASPRDLQNARPEQVGMSPERLTLLTDGMQAIVDQGKLAGVVTMVARHGKIVHFEAAGKRDIAANARMQNDTIFRIYSMTKPVTGVAMMMLFEQGKWQLNDPVSKYIPEFADLKVYAGTQDGKPILKEQNHSMTMRELMSHTAGFTYGYFGNTPVDKMVVEADVLNPGITLDEMIGRVAKIPLYSQPGSEWHYSIATDIQGYIVQKLSGMPFEEFLEKNIFKPLDMTDTAFYVPQEKLRRFAELYTYDKEDKLVVEKGGWFNRDFSKPPKLASGGGGLVSTARDYMRFCQMLLNGGSLNNARLLSPLTIELMRTNVLPSGMMTMAPGALFGLDFAVYVDPVRAGGYYGRGTYWWGGIAGTWFWIDPVNNVIVIGMIQQMSSSGGLTGAGVPDVRGLSRALTYQAIVR